MNPKCSKPTSPNASWAFWAYHLPTEPGTFELELPSIAGKSRGFKFLAVVPNASPPMMTFLVDEAVRATCRVEFELAAMDDQVQKPLLNKECLGTVSVSGEGWDSSGTLLLFGPGK